MLGEQAPRDSVDPYGERPLNIAIVRFGAAEEDIRRFGVLVPQWWPRARAPIEIGAEKDVQRGNRRVRFRTVLVDLEDVDKV